MKVLVPARFRAWLKKWGRKLHLLLASLGLGSKSIQTANIKTIHDKNDLLDLTEQISKDSSRYPVAQGSFGDVWKCIRKHPRITVAVKCLRLEIPNDSCKTKITERLEHDLQRSTQLKHANLLPLLGITQGFGPLPAIVSPWMHKGSLTMLLERDFQQLTLTRMLQILKDVASALQYLHSKNIVHGDLTGNNILIDENGNAFVADHGILIFCAELHDTSYIRSNVRWAAPENFQVPEDDESISSPQLASDIYSFGCIMLQVFTGKVPYSEFRSDHQVAVQILRGRKPARPVTPPIADVLWDFMQKCWLDEPEHRPSAKEVLTFIQEQLKLPEENSRLSHATHDAIGLYILCSPSWALYNVMLATSRASTSLLKTHSCHSQAWDYHVNMFTVFLDRLECRVVDT